MWVCRSASSAGAGLALALVLALLGTTSASADEAAGTSFSHRMAQGRFFLDSRLWQQARAEFEAAVAMPQGQRDPEVHTLLARTAYRVGDVTAAVEAVRRARALSEGGPSDDLAELHEFLTTRFGKVLVIGAGASDAHLPQPVVPILDPELKGVFERAVDRMDEPASSGSTSIYLPVGTYRVGSHLVEVTPEGTARMDLRASVGLATGGVYGERRGGGERSGPVRGGGRPRLPGVLPSPTSWFSVMAVGQAFDQQGNGAGAGNLLIGWEGHAALPVGLRVVGGLSVGRMERITAETPAPAGVQPLLQLAGGAVLRPGRLLLMPWLAFTAGYGHPVESALPEGYQGPVHYVVFGPDVELRLGLPAITTGSGEQIRAQVGLDFLIRESRPLGPGSEDDPRPHLSVGGGLVVGLMIGQSVEVGS